MRNSLRATGALALTTGLLVAGASSASAHVTVLPSTTAAGSYSLLTFGVPHGCDGSSTTQVSIQIPEQIVAVTPTVNPGWEVEKVMEDLDTPVDNGHGGQYTQRVAEIVYTAQTPLPDGYRDAFVLSLKIPDAAGETLVFPAVQECEQGESAWVQVPEEGQDEDALELPAPSFVVTAAEDGEHSAAAAPAATAQPAANTSGAVESAGTDSVQPAQAVATQNAGAASTTPVATWVALALGAGGLILGLVALLRTRRAQG